LEVDEGFNPIDMRRVNTRFNSCAEQRLGVDSAALKSPAISRPSVVARLGAGMATHRSEVKPLDVLVEHVAPHSGELVTCLIQDTSLGD
jgi:hypothetical protein